MSNFKHPTPAGSLTIASVDTGVKVSAQYNPKELQIDKTVPWQKNPQANKSPDKGIQLEFTGAERLLWETGAALDDAAPVPDGLVLDLGTLTAK